MVVTPQTRPPALETCFDPPLLPVFPEKGIAVVIMVGVVVGCGATVWVGVGTAAGVLISSPGMTSGESKENDDWFRRER